jgi:hypothetical protein
MKRLPYPDDLVMKKELRKVKKIIEDYLTLGKQLKLPL